MKLSHGRSSDCERFARPHGGRSTPIRLPLSKHEADDSEVDPRLHGLTIRLPVISDPSFDTKSIARRPLVLVISFVTSTSMVFPSSAIFLVFRTMPWKIALSTELRFSPDTFTYI